MTYPEQIEMLKEEFNDARPFSATLYFEALDRAASLGLLEGKRQQHERVNNALAALESGHPGCEENHLVEEDVAKIIASLTPRESGE